MQKVDRKVDKVDRDLASLWRLSGLHVATRMMLDKVNKDAGSIRLIRTSAVHLATTRRPSCDPLAERWIRR